MKHKLKTYTEHLEDIISGKKPFELRRNDRNFQVGDILWLKGWDPVKEEYTGQETKVDVLSVLEDKPEFGLAPGFCIMGIKLRPKPPTLEEKKDYVEDISCLDAYPGLEITRVQLSDKKYEPLRSIYISWSSSIGFGELSLGIDADGHLLMDTECMGGDFIRALLTLFFLEANPQWDPRITEDLTSLYGRDGKVRIGNYGDNQS